MEHRKEATGIHIFKDEDDVYLFADPLDNNVILIGAGHEDNRINLKLEAMDAAVLMNKKEVGIFISKLKELWEGMDE